MHRSLLGTTLLVLVLMALSSFALAHFLTVTTPSGKVHVVWVGAEDIPGQGQGLIAGGPGGVFTLTPAHAKGLNNACAATEGNDVVDIRGPGGPGCPHGQ